MKSVKRFAVCFLGKTCEAIDAVLYWPAVARALLRLPVFWSCQLAKLSWHLDDRWRVGWWRDVGRPEALCEACRRRAAWLVVGGTVDDMEADLEWAKEFMSTHEVHLCAYCHLDDAHVTSESELQAALGRAGRKSLNLS